MIFQFEQFRRFLEHLKSLAAVLPLRDWKGENAIILRHDIDFDIAMAHRVAEIEKDGVVVNHWINETGSRYRRLGWHTDGLRDLAFLRLPEPMLNVGLYLDDSPLEKGGVRLLPGTHRQGLLPMMFRKLYFFDNREDPAEVSLTAEKGDLTIHDGRLWHRAAPSELEGEASRRRTMYMAYVDGPVRERTEDTPMALYHRFQKWAG